MSSALKRCFNFETVPLIARAIPIGMPITKPASGSGKPPELAEGLAQRRDRWA